MRIFIILVAVLSLFQLNKLQAQVGCRTGNYIYTVQNGTAKNGSSTIPKFTATDRITIRNYDNDPNCGIDRNTSNSYPLASPTRENPNSDCTSDFSLPDIGKLITYNNRDNTCHVPLDDYIPILLIASAGLGFFFLRKRRVLD